MEQTECKCTLPDDIKDDPLRHKKTCPVFRAWHEARNKNFAALRRPDEDKAWHGPPEDK